MTSTQHPGIVTEIVFSPDNVHLVAYSEYKDLSQAYYRAKYYNKNYGSISGNHWRYEDLPSDPNRFVRSASIWNLITGKLTAEFDDETSPSGVKFSPDGKHLATWSDSKDGNNKPAYFHLWNVISGVKTFGKRTSSPQLFWVQFSPDSTMLSCRAIDPDRISLYDTHSGEHLRDIPGSHIAWGSTGQSFAIFEHDGPAGNHKIMQRSHETRSLKLRDESNDKMPPSFPNIEKISGNLFYDLRMTFSPDGHNLAVEFP